MNKEIKKVFIAWDTQLDDFKMTLDDLMDDDFRYTHGLEVRAAANDEKYGCFAENWYRHLCSADFVVGLLNTPNANVLFELGIAFGLGKKLGFVSWLEGFPTWLKNSFIDTTFCQRINRLHSSKRGDTDAWNQYLTNENVWWSDSNGESKVPETDQTLFLASEHGNGERARAWVKTIRPDWAFLPNKLVLHNSAEKLAHFSRAVWCITKPNGERHGRENAINGFFAGFIAGRSLKGQEANTVMPAVESGVLTVLVSERDAPKIVDLEGVDTYRDKSEFTSLIAGMSEEFHREIAVTTKIDTAPSSNDKIAIRFQWDRELLASEIRLSLESLRNSAVGQEDIEYWRATAADFTWGTGSIAVCYALVETQQRRMLNQTGVLTSPLVKTLGHVLDREDRPTERRWVAAMFGWRNGLPTLFSLFNNTGRRGTWAVEFNSPSVSLDFSVDGIDISNSSEGLGILSEALAISGLNRSARGTNASKTLGQLKARWERLRNEVLRPEVASNESRSVSDDTNSLQWNVSCKLLPENADSKDAVSYIEGNPGTKLLIVGPGGIGKTTFLEEIAEATNWPMQSLRFLKSGIPRTDRLYPLLCDGLENVYYAQESTKSGHIEVERILLDSLEIPNSVCLSARSQFLDQYVDKSILRSFDRLQLSPWTDNQLDTFLGEKLKKRIDPRLRDLLAVPFYARLFKENEQAFDSLEVSSRFALIETCVTNSIANCVKQFGSNRTSIYRFLETFAQCLRKRRTPVPDLEIDALLELADLADPTLLPFIEKSALGYEFSHDIFGEFMVARFNLLAIQKLLAAGSLQGFQTTYDEDLYVAEQLSGNREAISSLEHCYANTDNRLLAVNALGILAKIDRYKDIDRVLHFVVTHPEIRTLYEDAVRRRVLGDGTEFAETKLSDEIKSGGDPVAAFFCLNWCTREKEALTLLCTERHGLPYKSLLATCG